MKSIIFISDLHLGERHTEIFVLFKQFLQQEVIAEKVSKLYILGDFFEWWAGDDDLTTFNMEVVNLLKNLTIQGIEIYLMPGNRDFVLGEGFAKLSGCKILPDLSVIDLYGKPTLLTHGDILCTKDQTMNWFRAVTRHGWCIRFFLSLPLKMRRKIAAWVQKSSANARKGAGKPKEVLAIDSLAVEKLLLQHNAKQMIHGHVHSAEIFSPVVAPTDFSDGHIRRFVLGDWQATVGNALFYYENGGFVLKTITKNSSNEEL